MSLITVIVQASTVLSSELPKVKTSDLLHYREELESAHVKLEQVLNTQAPKKTHESKGFCQTCHKNAFLTRALNRQNSTSESQGIPSMQFQLPIQPRSPQREASTQPSVLSERNDISEISGTPPAVFTQHDKFGRIEVKQPKEQSDKVSLLMKKLEEESENIRNFTSDTAPNVVVKGDWKGLDPRIIDANLPTKDKSLSTKFRAWLARCSLADEYLVWEKNKYHSSRVELLAKNQIEADTKKGHVSEYLNDHYGEPARKLIQSGIKCRVFERVYGTLGVSAFLFCVFSAFRNIPYMEFSSLAESIRDSQDWSTLADKKTSWLAESQETYNKSCRQYIHQQTQCEKHSIETGASSGHNQRKRAKRTPAGTPSATKHGSSSQLPDRNGANDVPKSLSTQTEVCASQNTDLGNTRLPEVQFAHSDNPIPITPQESVPVQNCDPFRDFNSLDQLGDFDPFRDFNSLDQLGDFDPFRDFNSLDHLGDFDPFRDFNSLDQLGDFDPFRDFNSLDQLGDFDPFRDFNSLDQLGDFDPFRDFNSLDHLGDFDPFRNF